MEMEVKLAKMACGVLLVWFLAWTPYAIMSIWVMFFESSGLSPILGVIPTLFTKISAGTNALIYGLR